MAALKARDAASLADLAHPVLGVRFTPFLFPSPNDVVLSPALLRGAFADPKVRNWGTIGESDDRIRTTFAKYFARYVYDADFAGRGPATAGTTDRNEAASFDVESLRAALRSTYPDGVVAEYRWPASGKGGNDDWRTLRIVCIPASGSYHLAGIVHGEPTP